MGGPSISCFRQMPVAISQTEASEQLRGTMSCSSPPNELLTGGRRQQAGVSMGVGAMKRQVNVSLLGLTPMGI